MTEWDRFEAKIIVKLSHRATHTVMEEELEIMRKEIGAALDDVYGEENVDLVWVTWHGKQGEDDKAPEGWGMSDKEVWDLIPGETKEEKEEFIRRSYEDGA